MMMTLDIATKLNTSRSPPYGMMETPASKRRRLGSWAMILGVLILVVGFYVMPGSRSIFADNQEALGFFLAMLGLVIVLLALFLLSRREERITYRLLRPPGP